jgi:hypothetical protein
MITEEPALSLPKGNAEGYTVISAERSADAATLSSASSFTSLCGRFVRSERLRIFSSSERSCR